MKIKMYMYDEDIKLDEEATSLFLEQLDVARESMKTLLDAYAEEQTRLVIFYMMSLRSYIDDFLEFCADELSVEEMEVLLNINDEQDNEDDEFEIFVDFDKEE